MRDGQLRVPGADAVPVVGRDGPALLWFTRMTVGRVTDERRGLTGVVNQ